MVWRLGCGLVVLGLLLVAFWCYLVWGTTLTERSGQSALAHALARQFAPRPAPSRSVSPAAPPFVWPRLSNGAAVARIQIPTIGLDQVVVEGTDSADLENGPGHYSATPFPGEAGNVAIAGHRTTYGHPFSQLGALRPGDRITLSVPGQTWRYVTTASMVVSPDDVEVLGPIGRTGGWLTLTTCNPPYSASTRLVVRAQLVGQPRPAATAASHGGPPSGATVAPAVSDAQGSWWGVVLWTVVLVALCLAALVTRSLARTWARRVAQVAVALVVFAVIWELFGAVASRLPAGF